jgi:chromosome segregation ATPase
MVSDPRLTPSQDVVDWMQRELHASRESEARSQVEIEQLRRMIYELAQRVEVAEKAAKTIEPRLHPFTFLPDKLQEVEHDVEDLRQSLLSTQSSVDSTLRVLESGSEAERTERGFLSHRIEEVRGTAGRLGTDISQVQQAVNNTNETLHETIQRIGETEKSMEQLRLRIERSSEVTRDIEQRIREEFLGEKEERFAIVFERLQVVGEMVKRTTDLIEEVAAEQTMREEVLSKIEIWRTEHERLEGRIAQLEGSLDSVFERLEKVAQAITVVEGRHTGLADRVAGVRAEFNGIVDQIREEFQKFNKLQVNARKRQIEALEQEARELKFHSLRPPEVQ